ncbi:MAG: 50S ribosomal protein L4 [Acidobacteria bacterium]|nr:50S ribosomal protein L4 [Acidobacteriota bacterium]
MKLDVVNAEKKTVGSIDLNDALFGRRVKQDLIWASVVRQNAGERRGTHASKNRALVSGSGKKPYAQKGTGRPQVGSSRTPLWRHGGTVFGPQPRSYAFTAPKKVERAGLREALAAKLQAGVVIVVSELRATEKKTKVTAAMLNKLGATGKTLVVDVAFDENFTCSARNIAGVRIVPSGRLTARDVMDTNTVIATQAAVERLQEVLG